MIERNGWEARSGIVMVVPAPHRNYPSVAADEIGTAARTATNMVTSPTNWACVVM